MVRKTQKAAQAFIESEIGTTRKSWRGKISVVLVYPHRYHVGMSNLGFQTLYQLLNSFDHVVCERAFLPEEKGSVTAQLLTLESGRRIIDADIIAFSISFENDYPYLLAILDKAGIPLRTKDRNDQMPLVIAGGVACFLNPEPISAYIDCFLIGEAEGILSHFFESFKPHSDKTAVLRNLALNVPGAYVPAFYQAQYHNNGTLAAFLPIEDVPPKIERVYFENLDHVSTCSAIVTPNTTFERSFLVEIGRGCPHGCRFCSAGFVYRPPRFRTLSQLEQAIDEGSRLTDRIGLVGAAVSDLPDIDKLCAKFHDQKIRISFSSLRADRLSPGLLTVLKQSKVKTATIAPEVGSQHMRNVINKGLTEEDILSTASALVENGIPNLKLYFMVGLPSESQADIDAIISLVKQIKHRFLTSSRTRKRIGQITVSLNSFVPKPFTPFQWVAMNEIGTLKRKIKKIKNDLKKVANVTVNSDIPRWGYIQAMFSRGDRRVADILAAADTNQGNWVQTLKSVPTNPDFYVYREREVDELFPWDFIDHGIKKSFLQKEYQLAKQGRTTPACQVENCRICGVCNEDEPAH